MILSSTEGTHGRYSGYRQLGLRFEGAIFIEVARPPVRGLVQRLLTATLTRVSLVRWTRISSLTLENRGFQAVREKKANLIHVLWGDRDVCFADLRKKGDVPLVVSMHNCRRDLENLFTCRARLRKVDAWITVAACQQAWLAEAGVPQNKIHTVLHGVDTDYFRPKRRKKNNKFKILVIGSWRRNFQVYEKILHELDPRKYEVRCRIDQPWRNQWTKYPCFTPLGVLSDEQLKDEYQQADCFLLAAEDSTANNALIEAMACATPIIAERVGGIPEYLGADYPGLFEARSSSKALDKIGRVKRENHFKQYLSGLSKKRSNQLKWEAKNQEIEKIYKEISRHQKTILN